jgi:hypothetical protein
VTGVGSQYDRLETARRAAEEDARSRLASSLETTLESRYEGTTRRELAVRGDDVERFRLSRRTHEEIRTVASATIRGASPEDEYAREYEVFGEGWEKRYDCWILLGFSRSEYDRLLRTLLEDRAR